MNDHNERYQQAAALLKDAMRRKNMLQADVVKASVSDFTVRKVLGGRVHTYRRPSLVKIAKAVDLPDNALADLLPLTDDAPRPSRPQGDVAAPTNERMDVLEAKVDRLTSLVERVLGIDPAPAANEQFAAAADTGAGPVADELGQLPATTHIPRGGRAEQGEHIEE